MTMRRALTGTITLLLSLSIAFAQQAPGQPPTGQVPRGGRAGMGAGQNAGPVSPEILPDKRVTFRLLAPGATKVVLNGDWEGGSNVAMTKDANGIWSVTVGPLAAELWGPILTSVSRIFSFPAYSSALALATGYKFSSLFTTGYPTS